MKKLRLRKDYESAHGHKVEMGLRPPWVLSTKTGTVFTQ